MTTETTDLETVLDGTLALLEDVLQYQDVMPGRRERWEAEASRLRGLLGRIHPVPA